MTRVEIFKKWYNKELTDAEAIRLCKKAPKPIMHSDGYTDVWFDGEEENDPYSIQMLSDDGYDETAIRKFFIQIIHIADS